MAQPLADFVWMTAMTDTLLVLASIAGGAFLLLAGNWMLRKPLATLRALADARALAEAINRSQMMIELGMDGTILKVNANYVRFIGYAPEEVEGQQLSKVVPGEDLLNGTYDTFWKTLRAGEPLTGVYARVNKKGQRIWLEAKYSPILDAHGVPVKVVGLLSDVTERTRMEQVRLRQEAALQKSEQFLAETANLAEAGGWEIDLVTSTTIWMPETYRLLGADPSHEPTLREALSRYSEESRPRITQAIERAKRDGTGWDLELSLVRMDGRPMWARVVGRAHMVDGKPVSLFGIFQDITARVAEKKALEDANERIALATEAGGCGIWEWDILRDRMIFDARTMRLYELADKADPQLTCRGWIELLHPEDREAVVKNTQESLEGKRPFDTEFRLILQDGKVRFLRASGKVIRDPSGRPVRMLGTNFEITAQKEAQESLREQASLLDLCHDAIIVRDMKGLIQFWNKGAEEIYGFPKERTLGLVSHDVLRTIFPAPLAEIERVFLERERWEGELTHHTETGRPVVVESRWALKHDKNGRPIGVMEINTDITERKQAEEALRQSVEQEKLLIDGVKDYAIIMLDPQGNITTWNQGAEQIKGYKSEEILGRHVSVFYPKDAIAAGKPKKVLDTARAEGRYGETGWRVRKDGSSFWANVVITALFDPQGQLRGYCKITRDITESKLAEEATENARIAADLANRAKSDFLANMSHEVRTPVNAIMGMVHLALRADPQPRQREYLLKIDTAAKRLLGIMNDILDFSKIEAGKLKLERIQFNFSEVMQGLRDVVEHKAREKNLALVFSVAPNVPAYLSGDPLRLGQVLINLVNNAVKFTEQGEVKVTVALESEEAESLCLRFAVADTGIGMTALQMQNLFQAFHQADTSFTRQYGGTGLGLVISKQLVEMMGGSIDMESQFGAGSTFTFTVKMGRADRSASRLPANRLASRGASRILVVDDSENTRDELVQLLRHHRQQAYGTSSGEEAIRLLVEDARRGDPFHLVVMDWRLPGLNGLEVARRIRGDIGLQPTPIILMISAFDRNDIAPATDAAAFDGFLLKPLREESFLESVWSLLDGRKSTGPANAPAQPADTSVLVEREVLLVEDNDLNRHVAIELLGDLGVKVTVALDGQAAVNAVSSRPFDLVLMDIQMPVMDGLTATRTIRSDPRFDRLPIVAMTAHAMTGDYERSLAAGMNDHITKPIDPDVLTKTLLRWMPPGGKAAPKPTPAPPPPAVVPDHLPPFNLAAALLRTNNKPLLLRKLLLGFRQQYSSAVPDLNAFLCDQKWAEAQRLVHSLKSIAAMLETRPLAEAADAVETALRNGQRNGLEPLIDQLDATLQPAIAAVATMDQTAAVVSH